MGTNCRDHPGPIIENPCNDEVGQTMRGRNFCTYAGGWGYSIRVDFCRNISDGEWEYDGAVGTCSYNDCDGITDFGSGCCNGCCGILGNGVRCKRRAFRAEPLRCCLRDMPCSGPSGCYQDNLGLWTCPTQYRSQASRECRDELFNYCIGADVPLGQSEVWINRWLGEVTLPPTEYSRGREGPSESFDRPCYHALYRNLYNNQAGQCLGIPGVGVPDTAGFNWGQRLMTAMISRYQEDGGSLVATEAQEGNTRLNSMIWDICSKTPGLCAPAMYAMCSAVTTETLTRQTSLLPWCGCYMGEGQYSRYTDLYRIDRACTPQCSRAGVLPLPTENGIGRQYCTQTVCLIDSISIQLAQSQVGESGINFSQVCSACSVEGFIGSCSCIIADSTFTLINATVPNFDISQQCGADSACYTEVTNDDGSVTAIQVPCNSDPSADPTAIERESEQNYETALLNRNLRIAFIIIVSLMVVLLVWWIATYLWSPKGNQLQ